MAKSIPDQKNGELFDDIGEDHHSHEDDILLDGSHPHRYSNKNRHLWLGFVTFVLLVGASMIITLINPLKTSWGRYQQEHDPNIKLQISSPSKVNNLPHLCGNSSAQARARGCRFHQLTWSWLPPGCPVYANEEFMEAADTPWIWYEDREETKVVGEATWERVLDGELRVFGQRREHITHCIFMFLSVAQMVRDGTPFHAKLAKYGHIEHCADMILKMVKKSPDWNNLDTLSGTVSFDQFCK